MLAAVDTDGEIMDRWTGHTNWAFKNRRLVLYHFITRSAADWAAKLQRRGGWRHVARPA
jgi:hypothetical protein